MLPAQFHIHQVGIGWPEETDHLRSSLNLHFTRPIDEWCFMNDVTGTTVRVSSKKQIKDGLALVACAIHVGAVA